MSKPGETFNYDITRFFQAVIAGELSSPESLAEMQKTIPVEISEAGLGIFRYTNSCGVVSWGHSGMLQGFTSNTEVTADGRHVATVTNSNIFSPKIRDLADAGLCG